MIDEDKIKDLQSRSRIWKKHKDPGSDTIIFDLCDVVAGMAKTLNKIESEPKEHNEIESLENQIMGMRNCENCKRQTNQGCDLNKDDQSYCKCDMSQWVWDGES